MKSRLNNLPSRTNFATEIEVLAMAVVKDTHETVMLKGSIVGRGRMYREETKKPFQRRAEPEKAGI